MSVSSLVLTYRHIFGLNAAVKDNIWFFDSDAIFYTAGHNLILYSTIERRQKFVHGAEHSECLTALTLCPSRRFAAVAEKSERGVISVYDLKTLRKRKHLQNTLNTSREFVSLCFSGDNQYLLSLTGGPDATLIYWNWPKGRPIASVTACVCVSGKETLKFYRLTETDFRPMPQPRNTNHNFTCHVWLKQPPDYLLAGTIAGDLLLFESGDYLCRLSVSPGLAVPITAMALLDEGIMIGSTRCRLMTFRFNVHEDDSHTIVGPTMLLPCNATMDRAQDLATGEVTCIAVSQNGSVACTTTSDGQLLCIPIGAHADIRVEAVGYMVTPFHGGHIVGLDVCERKPLLVTCSRDLTVKIFNFVTLELEISKSFADEIFYVSIHPSGLHIAIGFADKLRLFHVLVDELKPYKEFAIKGCRECAFSTGGHMLAAANGNAICLFDFHTGEKICDLRGHNGKVRCISWTAFDMQIVSCGQDGAVYVWDIEDMKRNGEFVHKGTMYTSVTTAVGSDKILKELEYPDLQVHKEIDAGITLTHVSIAKTKNLLFVGTGDIGKPGSVRAYVFPITGEYVEFTCMASAVSRLKCTPNESYLVVTDTSGCICIFDVRERSGLQRADASLDEYSDDVLVTRAELEDRSALESELRTKTEELKVNNEYQLKIREMNHHEKVRDVTESFARELEQARSKFELLKEERNDLQVENAEKLKRIGEKHIHTLREIESTYQAQIMVEVERYHRLLRDRNAQQDRLEDTRAQMIRTHERYVMELTEDFDEKLDEDRQLRLQLEESKTEQQCKQDETTRQLEDDVDTEIDTMRRRSEEKLSAARETTLKYKGENGVMRKKSSVLKKDTEDQNEEIKIFKSREKELHDQVHVLEKEINAHKKDIKARDQTIGDKERKIYELKKKNQELEKFKFVLDYKIKELKKQIDPREQAINGMKNKIKNIDIELERYHKHNTKLDDSIGELRRKLDSMQHDIQNKRLSARRLETSISRFKGAIHTAVSHVQDPAQLQASLQALIVEHGSHHTNVTPLDPSVVSECMRQKLVLEENSRNLRAKLSEDLRTHQSHNMQLMTSNMALVGLIVEQRKSNKLLQQQLQAQLGSLQQAQLKRVGKPCAEYDVPQSTNGAQESVLDNLRAVSAGELNQMHHNREVIAELRANVEILQSRLRGTQRAYSREMLPPMDGVGAMPESL